MPPKPKKKPATPRAARKGADRPKDAGRPAEILAHLEKAYPDWGPTLDFQTPWELLVATILAAQNTDENVNETKARVRALIRGFAQSALGGNTEDRILPALVWLDWLGRSPVLAEKGDAPTAAERVNILRVLIDSADSTGRAGQLDDAMARYALAHLLVSVGDPSDAAEAAARDSGCPPFGNAGCAKPPPMSKTAA